MKRLVLLGLGISALAACGDNNKPGGNGPDAPAIDAPPPIDTPPTDAAVATHSGTITFLSVRLKNMGGAGVDGNGIQIGISFSDNATAPAPLMEEQPGSLFGCKLWEYTPTQIGTVLLGQNEGDVTITSTNAAHVYPVCKFMNGLGYVCPGNAGSTNGAVMASPSAGVTQMTLAGATFSGLDVGRYIRFSGTGNAMLDNQAYPILMAPAATIIVIGGPSVTATLNAGTYAVFAGVGPMPGATPQTFLADDTEGITFAKAETANFEAFGATAAFNTTGLNPGVGNDFTLGTMNGKVTPTTIPTDGSAFTIGCDDAAGCGASGNNPGALGSILNIITTDTAVTGVPSPFYFPLPTTKRVQIRCITIGATTLTVPAAMSAHLTHATSGTTRIQTTFIRANQAAVMNQNGAPNTVNIAGGHAEVGFTTPP